MDRIVEFINKNHMSVEEIEDDMMDFELNMKLTEAVGDDLDREIADIEERLFSINKDTPQPTPQATPQVPEAPPPDINMDAGVPDTMDAPASDPTASLDTAVTNNTDTQPPSGSDAFDFKADETPTQSDVGDLNASGANAEFSLDPQANEFPEFGSTPSNSKDTNADALNSSEFDSEQNKEDQKARFLGNVKQLMRLRDILDELISSTSDKRFIKINQYIGKILSNIAGVGNDVLYRSDLQVLNNQLEEFMTDAVEQIKAVLDTEYKKGRDQSNVSAERKLPLDGQHE